MPSSGTSIYTPIYTIAKPAIGTDYFTGKVVYTADTTYTGTASTGTVTPTTIFGTTGTTATKTYEWESYVSNFPSTDDVIAQLSKEAETLYRPLLEKLDELHSWSAPLDNDYSPACSDNGLYDTLRTFAEGLGIRFVDRPYNYNEQNASWYTKEVRGEYDSLARTIWLNEEMCVTPMQKALVLSHELCHHFHRRHGAFGVIRQVVEEQAVEIASCQFLHQLGYDVIWECATYVYLWDVHHPVYPAYGRPIHSRVPHYAQDTYNAYNEAFQSFMRG